MGKVVLNRLQLWAKLEKLIPDLNLTNTNFIHYFYGAVTVEYVYRVHVLRT
jgi:hypothetical protein